MSVRFWRRFKIFPGVWLNISKSGISFSLGTRGAKYTLSTKGHRGTVGIPGSGLSYSKFASHKKLAGIDSKRKKNDSLELSEGEIQNILDKVDKD